MWRALAVIAFAKNRTHPWELNMKKIVLVTGANRGIGLELSRQLVKADYQVLVAARSEEKAVAAAKEVGTDDNPALPVVLEATSSEDIAALTRKIEGEFGRLDALVNNAGAVFAETFMTKNADTVSQDVLRKTFDVNFFAPIELTQALLPLLKKSEGGRIVNMSSVLGSMTVLQNSEEMAGVQELAYNSSKAALNMFTVALSAALGDGQTKVFSAHPGWVQTDLGGEMAPMGIEQGAKTAFDLVTGADDPPSGSFRHLGDSLPW